MAAVFAWYVGDRLAYGLVDQTWTAAVMDWIHWLVFWPVHSVWGWLYGLGVLPLRDYAYEFVLYRGLQGLWLLVLGLLLGPAVGLAAGRCRRQLMHGD